MRARALTLLAMSLSAPGCLTSMQSGTSTVDEVREAGPGRAQLGAAPYVEAYIEYPGPQARWSGPSTFLMHVTAKDAGPAGITVVPALFSGLDSRIIKAKTPGSSTLMGDQARTMITALANSLQGADAAFRGCLAPVRVRLVRADGNVLEKTGCRGQSGWVGWASKTVHQFIQAALFGILPSAAALAEMSGGPKATPTGAPAGPKPAAVSPVPAASPAAKQQVSSH